MSKRVFAVAAAVVVALVWAGGPASAQTYPPAPNSITVDDSTPAPGQAIVVTLQTCRAGTTALIGIDLTLVGTPSVGDDGVARVTVTVPPGLGPGRHAVSGACLAPDSTPLFLRTFITVETASGAGAGGGGGPVVGGAVPPPGGTGGAAAAAGGSRTAKRSGSGGDTGGLAGRAAAPSLSSLDGSSVPADAGLLYEDTAAANGVTEGGGSAPRAMAERAADTGDSDPSALSSIARVALGVAALAGVPVALAISRRPRRVVRQGFA